MVAKRHCSDDDRLGSGEVQEPKRRAAETVVGEVIKGVSMQEFVLIFEPLLRRVVREELERISQSGLPSLPRTSVQQIGQSVSRRWQLRIRNKLPHTLFTNNKIEAANGGPVQIVMWDAISKRAVTTGPLSSVKVQIFALDGDFGTDENENWSKDEFDASVILQRKGKRPLVAGDLQITLIDGVGHLGDAIFTDNSSWTRSRKFRLGARVVGGSCTNEEIREARSEAFMVKDHRGQLYKKHHPPFLHDQVWRLEKIGKDGAFHNRLTSYQVNNVQDFFRLLVTKPSHLRTILGSGMSDRICETIVQHVKSCTLDNKRYVYYTSEQQYGLVFDSVYRLMGITFDCQRVVSLKDLALNQSLMNVVEVLKCQAYRNLDQITEVDWPLVDAPSVAVPLEGSFPGTSLDSQPPEISVTFQDQSANHTNLQGPSNVLPHTLQDPAQLEDFPVSPSCYPVHLHSKTEMSSFEMDSPLPSVVNDSSQWEPGESSDSVAMDGYLTGDDTTQFQSPNWYSVTPWGQGNSVFMTSGDETVADLWSTSPMPDICLHMTGNSKPNMKWTKVKAAIKWVVVTKSAVAARRGGSSN